MRNHPSPPSRRPSIRPLVRYVDDELAVIEFRLNLGNPGGGPYRLRVELEPPEGAPLQAHIELAPEGEEHIGRLELPEPHRWWPAGLGEQALYLMTVTVEAQREPLLARQTLIGLTSVRKPQGEAPLETLLVNGRELTISECVSVEPDDESALLPAGGRSLLLVRHHFGPDRLYEAADRAGLLLLQEVPAGRESDRRLRREIDRLLSGHPSLAGWLIEPSGGGENEPLLRQLDPTRMVMATHTD